MVERARVAFVDSSEELLLAVRDALEPLGFSLVTAQLQQLQRGEPRPEAFLLEHRPDAVVWDVPYPYGASWRFLGRVLRSVPARGLPFVVTTTSPYDLALAAAADGFPLDRLPIVAKPYDAVELTRTLCALVPCRPPFGAGL